MDDSGAVIPAANVSLVKQRLSKTAQTQADGSYTFPGSGAGPVHRLYHFPGFAPFTKVVTVTAGGTVQVPIQLVRSRRETGSHGAGARPAPTVSVEPDNNATALVIKGADLDALPDDPDDFPSALQALAGPGAGPNGGQIYIDGFSGGQLPPKESIREIRINQNPFSAEYDRLGFGRIEILTKPGTDKLRGAISFNDSDGVFNSRNPFSNNKPDFSIAHVERQPGRIAQQEGVVLHGFQPPRRAGQLDHRGAVFRSQDADAIEHQYGGAVAFDPSWSSRRALDYAAQHQQHPDRARGRAPEFARTTPAWAARACPRPIPTWRTTAPATGRT